MMDGKWFLFRYWLLAVLFMMIYPHAYSAVYVAPNGQDHNPGTADKPLLSIEKAVRQAYKDGSGRVFLMQGVYTPAKGLPAQKPLAVLENGISVSGGWNQDFSAVTGVSRLMPMGRYYSVIRADNVSGLTLQNLAIEMTGFKRDEYTRWDGAIHLSGTVNSLVTNCSVAGEYSPGLYLAGTGNRIFMTVLSNTNTAGILMKNCTNNYLDCTVAGSGGRGVESEKGVSNVYKGLYTGNLGGIALKKGRDEIVDAVITFNKRVPYGGGVYLTTRAGYCGSRISGYIAGNEAQSGGGICIFGDGYRLTDTSTDIRIDAVICSNRAAFSGGGVYLWYTGQSLVRGEIFDNIAWSRGGGLYVRFGLSNTYKIKAHDNRAYLFGGAYINGLSPNLDPASVFRDNRQEFMDPKLDISSMQDLMLIGGNQNINALFNQYKPFYDSSAVILERNDGAWKDKAWGLEDGLLEYLLFFRLFKPEWFQSLRYLDFELMPKITTILPGTTAHVDVAGMGSGRVAMSLQTEGVEYRLGIFLHEFFHVYENRIMDREDYSRWVAMNPRGFKYAGYDRYESITDHTGFYNSYSMSTLAEDLAECFSVAYTYQVSLLVDGAVPDFCRSDPVLLKKVQFMAKKLVLIFPGFGDREYLKRNREFIRRAW